MSTALTKTGNHLQLAPTPQQTNLVNLDSPTTIQTITNSICKGATPEQLSTFLTLAKHFNLNPFNKEIYFSSQIGVFVGRHGKLRIANRHPDFKGLISCEIREKDEFVYDAANNKIVKHLTGKNMGKIIGAWATGKRKGFDDVTRICWLDEYKKSNPAWTNYTQDLIIYKAEDRVLRTLFNSEYEGINTVDPEDELIVDSRTPFSDRSPAIADASKLWLDSVDEDDYKEADKTPVSAIMETGPVSYITDKQRTMLFTKATKLGISSEQVKAILVENGLIEEIFGEISTKNIKFDDFEKTLEAIDNYAVNGCKGQQHIEV